MPACGPVAYRRGVRRQKPYRGPFRSHAATFVAIAVLPLTLRDLYCDLGLAVIAYPAGPRRRGDRIGHLTAAKIYEIAIEHAEAGERITKTEAERLVAELRRKAMARTGRDFPIIVIQEAGLDGFRVHRVLQSEGIESHVVDAGSILTSRRRRRAKTDRIANICHNGLMRVV